MMAGLKWQRTLNITLGADTTSLDKGLKLAKQNLKEATQEARILQESLKWDASPDAIVRAQTAAQAAIKASTEQVEMLKEAIKKVGENGGEDASKHIKLLTVQLESAQNEARKAADRMANLAGAEFRGNMSKASEALDGTNRKLAALKASLELKWDDDTFVQMQKGYQTSLDQTRAKVDLVRQELARIGDNPTSEKDRAQFGKLTTDLIELENVARKTGQELEKTNQQKLDRLGAEFRENLAQADASLDGTNRKLAALKASLELKWDDDTFVQVQKGYQTSLDQTRAKADLVRQELARIGDNPTSEKDRAQFGKLTTDLIELENVAQRTGQELEKMNQQKLDRLGAEFRENLAQADASLDGTNRKLAALKASLELKWSNRVFDEMQKEARSAIDQTNDRIKVLQGELARVGNNVSTAQGRAEFDAINDKIEELKTNAQQAERNLSQMNQVKFDRITAQISRAGDALLRSGAVMTAGITLPLAYVGKQALETASQLSEVQNVVDQSFKDGAVAIDNWSKSLLDSHGISELTAKQYSGLFKSMSNGMQIADKAGTGMAQTLTELIPDVASYYNLSLDAVGDKLKSIYTGETESLKEIGVIMTENNLNAYALSKGMAGLSDSMSQQEKVALRYSFVMDSLKDAQGDFARTLETSLANQTRLAGEQFKTLSASVAQELLPMATDLLKWANDLMRTFSQMDDSGKQATLVIIGLAAGIGPAVTVIGGMTKAVSGVRTALTAFKTASDAAAVSQAALNAVSLASPTALVVAGLVAVVSAVVIYNNTLEDAAKVTGQLNAQLKETVSAYEQVAVSSEKSVSQFDGEALVADNLIKRYDELNGKVGITTAEKEVLSIVVNKLNELLGTTITLSNQEAAIYDTTTASLRNLIQARRDEISEIALKNKAVAAGEALLDIQSQKEDSEKNVQYWKEKKESGDLYSPYKVNLSLGIDKYDEALEQYNAILKKEKEYQKQIEDFAKNKSQMSSTSPSENPATNEYYSKAKRDADALNNTEKERLLEAERIRKANADEVAKKEKADLDYRRDIGLVDKAQYIAALKEMQKKHYQDNQIIAIEESDFEKQLNVSIYTHETALHSQSQRTKVTATTAGEGDRLKIIKESYEQQKKIAKDACDQGKKLLKDSYDAEKKEISETNKLRKDALERRYKEEVSAIESAYKAKEKLINDQIKAIDAEIAARRRLKEESEQDSAINSVKAQLEYSKLDEFSRLELEAELKRLEDAKAEYQWQKEQENRKDSLAQELDDAKIKADLERQTAADLYAQRKEALQSEYDTANANLEASYALSIDRLDAQYKLHTTQLDSMFASSSTQMGKISGDFVSAIKKGCTEAASELSKVLDRAENASRAARQSQNVSYNTTNNRTANLNVSQGYSEAQMKRIAESLLY